MPDLTLRERRIDEAVKGGFRDMWGLGWKTQIWMADRFSPGPFPDEVEAIRRRWRIARDSRGRFTRRVICLCAGIMLGAVLACCMIAIIPKGSEETASQAARSLARAGVRKRKATQEEMHERFRNGT